ncbi:MAG TPA: hypothetical protein VFT72_02995 [Opitutaceae bacterium]|nr:hypothetical protein [Opitutaceae bacterium]
MHRFTVLPEDKPEVGTISSRLEQTLAIKRWTREVLRLPEDAVVTVNEFCCADPGCPLLESIVTVHDENATRTWRLTRPAAAVTKMMIQQSIGASKGEVRTKNAE